MKAESEVQEEGAKLVGRPAGNVGKRKVLGAVHIRGAGGREFQIVGAVTLKLLAPNEVGYPYTLLLCCLAAIHRNSKMCKFVAYRRLSDWTRLQWALHRW